MSNLLNRLLSKFSNRRKTTNQVIPRARHTISRKVISQAALRVMYRLKESGHAAYLVGGGVRDILLDRDPKDFDVVTDAHPEVVRNIFRNSRIIGRRFRLVHVYFDGDIVEVSTFRANLTDQTRVQVDDGTGMIFRDNTYGTIEEDAWRRDFTVNALYYNIADFSVVDYMQGMQDLKNRLLRVIGDPAQRYHEDPVRLLRALRLAAKLNFRLEAKTESALQKLPHLLKHVPPARLFDEFLKLFFEGYAEKTFSMLRRYHYWDVIFPQTASALKNIKTQKLIQLALKATDDRLRDDQGVNHGFLLAVFLWPVLQERMQFSKNKSNKKDRFYFQVHRIMHEVMKKQLETLMIPKRLQYVMQAIWILQFQLERRRQSRINSTLQHRYFRAAYDFLMLRVEAGDADKNIMEWWKSRQESIQPVEARLEIADPTEARPEERAQN